MDFQEKMDSPYVFWSDLVHNYAKLIGFVACRPNFIRSDVFDGFQDDINWRNLKARFPFLYRSIINLINKRAEKELSG